MTKLRSRCLVVLLATITVLTAIPALACKLPVFRYALERWSVDRYRLIAIVETSDDLAVQDALTSLNSLDRGGLNMDIEIIELGKLSEDELWQVEGLEDGTTSNRLQVYYPPRNGTSRRCWDGELTIANVNAWLDSPLRRTLAADIVAGVSAVWILVEGTNQETNDRVAEDLDAALRQAESEIVIPDGVILRDEASEYLRAHPHASMDDVLRCDVPLKVEFRMRRLSRDNVDERATLAMINGLSGELDRPVLVPVFGRGRMLDAIVTDEINPESILRACRYMVSECSCTVKALNPGTDMLLPVDWQKEIGANIVLVEVAASNEPVMVEVPGGVLADDVSHAPHAPNNTAGYAMGIMFAIAFALVLSLRLAQR